MPLEDFTIEQELGKGSFGIVFKCKRKVDGKIYAIKQVRIGKLKQKDRVNALNEIRILASITDPNIVEYKEAFYDQPTGTLCIVMQFADQGDLQSKIKTHHKKGTRFEEKQVWQVAFDLLLGLKKLHDSNIIHRDLKSANVFLSGGHAKLGDLNISKILKNQMATTQTGTPYYACPEVWSDMPYGSKSDVWSLGCVVYEMCSLKPPFRAPNFENLYKKIMGGHYDKIPLVYSTNLCNFICRCLTVNEKKRASVEQLLNFKVFKDLGLASENYEVKESAMLETIELPKNYAELNQVLPTSKYNRSIVKLKTVAIIEDQEKNENINIKRLPSISKIRSEKLLPSLPQSTKLLPLPQSIKPLGSPLPLRKIDSSKGLRIHKPLRSNKLIPDD